MFIICGLIPLGLIWWGLILASLGSAAREADPKDRGVAVLRLAVVELAFVVATSFVPGLDLFVYTPVKFWAVLPLGGIGLLLGIDPAPLYSG